MWTKTFTITRNRGTLINKSTQVIIQIHALYDNYDIYMDPALSVSITETH